MSRWDDLIMWPTMWTSSTSRCPGSAGQRICAHMDSIEATVTPGHTSHHSTWDVHGKLAKCLDRIIPQPFAKELKNKSLNKRINCLVKRRGSLLFLLRVKQFHESLIYLAQELQCFKSFELNSPLFMGQTAKKLLIKQKYQRYPSITVVT